MKEGTSGLNIYVHILHTWNHTHTYNYPSVHTHIPKKYETQLLGSTDVQSVTLRHTQTLCFMAIAVLFNSQILLYCFVF